MKLLIALDSASSTEVLVGAVGVRPWPAGTTVHVLSVVVDADVPLEVWREFRYGKDAVRREMENRGNQITNLAGGSGGDKGRPSTSDSILRAEVVFGLDLRARSRPQGL